jgi:hypothetical protein
VQTYVDLSAKGYYLHAYTKVLAELKLFGLSNAKINASLIPKVYEFRKADGSIDVEKTRLNAGLDADGNPIYDDFEGINHEEAFMLLSDAEYSKSVSGICIGYSDAHILKLLDDNKVQLIIGFHDKTDDPDKRYKGARYAKNYNGLNEAVKVKADGTTETVHIGFNQFVIKAEKMFKQNANGDFEGIAKYNGKSYVADDIPRLATDLYLEHCEKKNLVPAYHIEIGEDANGNKLYMSDHPNYYKLLGDFGLKNSEGHYAPHKKVQFNMPDTVPYLENGVKKTMSTRDYIKNELEKEMVVRDDIASALEDNTPDGIIPQFVEKVNELHDAQEVFQDRDSTGRELSPGQIEFFKDSKVRDENGRLIPVYHGTPGNMFYEFSYDNIGMVGGSQHGYGFYFTDDEREANLYSQGSGNVIKSYISITNPIYATESDLSSDVGQIFDRLPIYAKNTLKEQYGDLDVAKNQYSKYDNGTMLSILVKETGMHPYVFNNTLTNLGYDGIIYSEEGYANEYVVFKSNQAKLTTNLNPTESGDTRYQDRVTPEEDAVYMEAYYDGDDDLMQELVDKAAHRLGYKYKAYHHTENGFTVFDLDKARKSMDIQGFYFSADKDAESEYGSVRYDSYLKMDNPYIVDSKEKREAIPFDLGNENAGVIAREWLQSRGYDSVIRKAEYYGAEADEYIVFDSSQIKSAEPMTFADDEYGEGDIIPLSERFNEVNKDIRYQ